MGEVVIVNGREFTEETHQGGDILLTPLNAYWGTPPKFERQVELQYRDQSGIPRFPDQKVVEIGGDWYVPCSWNNKEFLLKFRQWEYNPPSHVVEWNGILYFVVTSQLSKVAGTLRLVALPLGVVPSVRLPW
jgi:hypothetical protein